MSRHGLTDAGRWQLVALAWAGIASAVAAGAAEPAGIAANFPDKTFETTTPEAAGWSAERIGEAKAWSLKIAPTAAVMIIQHGRVVAEWGDVASKSNLH